MFAEQHRSSELPHQYFSSKERAPKKKEKAISEEIKQFDLNFSFKGLPDLIKRYGPEQGLYQCILGVALNIWSLRQEMLGEMDTRELITLVSKEADGSLRFKNDLFGQSQDLRSMYLSALDFVPSHLRPRYKREADQAITVFETLTSPVRSIDFSLPKDQLITQLELNGFHEEEIDISPSLFANVASLRNQIHSISDLDAAIAAKLKMKVYVGPAQVLSGSPSHWSHHKGETIFAWASECIVFPETKEICIRQNGKFGKGKDESLLPYLSYGQKETKTFNSEEELMQFTNILLEMNYHQPKVLLDFLVSQFGGIKPAGKIDRHIKEGNLSIQPYMDAIQDLFIFELSQMENVSLSKITQRLADFSEKIKHQIARNEPIALAEMVKKYKELSINQPQLSIKNFIEQMNLTALKLDRGFALSIDFRLLDCVAGTPGSLVANMDILSNLQISLGAENLSLLQFLDGRRSGITSKAELAQFCRAFGKDASKYATFRECGMCHKPTFVWGKEYGGCDVCPVCEVKDDLGIHGAVPASFSKEGNDIDATTDFDSGTLYSRSSIGVGDALSATTSGWQQFMVQ